VNKNAGGTVTGTTTYYPAGGGMRVNGTLYYVLKDKLGSASVVTDSAGNTMGEARYYPYGETRLTTGTMQTDRLFTGQREMAGLGIYHYGSRFYSPNLGRFLSADSIVPNASNPQDFNRYSYVRNNPVRYIDPSGHVCSDPDAPNRTCESGRSYPNNAWSVNRTNPNSWFPPVRLLVVGGGNDYDEEDHPGIDVNPDSAENPNPEVVASSSGVVYSSTACTIDPCVGNSVDANNGYGNVVIIGYDYDSLPQSIQALIPDGATLFMLYAHLEAPSTLQEGDTVYPGQLIGNVGNTGASGGTHLHLEIRIERNDQLPFGDIHNDTGWTTVHYTWHSTDAMTILDPHDFFDIP